MLVFARNTCPESSTYRAARVKSLFNVDVGGVFEVSADLPIDDEPWQIGVVVGPSGSGKTTIGRELGELYCPTWPDAEPIIDAIAPAGDFDSVTAALAAVGLGDVPAWLRPYGVLSNGERFRANLARLVCDAPGMAVVDEFTSVVDRQIAKIGALAFSKAWRRTGGRVVLLSCHYDILDWLQPDWVYDTSTATFHGRWLQPRPRITLDIHATDWNEWPTFEPHHYLKLPRMIAARNYVGRVDGESVCHVAVSTANKGGKAEARACRLVVLPEWQGAGIGIRFLNRVCQIQMEGSDGARLEGRRVTTIFHTSHPGLVSVLRRRPEWVQVSRSLYGKNRRRTKIHGSRKVSSSAGFGGHFRAVQGFRYVGEQS